MNRGMPLTFSLGLMLMLGSTSAAQSSFDSAATANAAKAAPAKGTENKLPSTNPTSPTYRIGPQDVLNVDVWKEPEVTRAVTVRPDGKISLPLLDDVQAVGLTPTELSAVISEGLKEYINHPRVTVTVSEVNSKRVFVTGEVMRSGAFPLLPNMTALQALSSCGGFTQFANTKKIYILRMQEGKQVKIPVNYKSLVSGRKPEDNVVLQTGDTVVVP